jgi:hypothetical protein
MGVSAVGVWRVLLAWLDGQSEKDIRVRILLEIILMWTAVRVWTTVEAHKEGRSARSKVWYRDLLGDISS